MVHTGNVANSSAGIFNLTGKIPESYRPLASMFFPVTQWAGTAANAARIGITTEGGVTYYIGATATREFHFAFTYISAS